MDLPNTAKKFSIYTKHLKQIKMLKIELKYSTIKYNLKLKVKYI